MRISLHGSEIAKAVNASGSVPGAFLPARVYDLAVVKLMHVGCPKEINAARENVALPLPIVIEKNRRKYGYIKATDYWPAAVVVAGGARRSGLMSRGVLEASAWVERGALKIQADDEISCEELSQKLSQALLREFYGDSQPMFGQPWPTLLFVYPFENYCIFEFGGQKYRQKFQLDPVSRVMNLDGEPVKVDEKFVNACSAGMPRVQSGERSTSNPMPLASNQVTNRGALTSDLFTQVVRNLDNVNETVAMLLSAIKFGLYKPMQPSFRPVPLSADGKILAPFVKAGIAPIDAMGWAVAVEKDPTLPRQVRRRVKASGSVRVRRQAWA